MPESTKLMHDQAMNRFCVQYLLREKLGLNYKLREKKMYLKKNTTVECNKVFERNGSTYIEVMKWKERLSLCLMIVSL